MRILCNDSLRIWSRLVMTSIRNPRIKSLSFLRKVHALIGLIEDAYSNLSSMMMNISLPAANAEVGQQKSSDQTSEDAFCEPAAKKQELALLLGVKSSGSATAKNIPCVDDELANYQEMHELAVSRIDCQRYLVPLVLV